MIISINLFFQGVEVRNGCPTRAVYHEGELLSVTRTAPGPPRPQGHPQPGVSLNHTPYIWVGVGVPPHTLDPKRFSPAGHLHLGVCVCVCAFVCLCMYICVRACACAFVYVCMYVCMHRYVDICVRVFVCLCGLCMSVYRVEI